MRAHRTLWIVVALVVVGVALMGCSLLNKGKKTETPISVETTTPPVTETTTTPPAETTPVTPTPAPYQPQKLDTLKMLAATLGSTAETLGWDNVFCSVAIEKDVELFTILQPLYAPGTADRNFIDASIKDLNNIKTFLDEKISKGEGVDPTGPDAKAKKAKIKEIQARVLAMISGPAPKKEPIPEWKGDLMKKKLYERDEMLKKKWAERGKK